MGVTLRGAARRAGVSQTAPYRHFPDKGALLAAVAEQGFRRLGRAMTHAARSHATDPVRALEAMAVALIGFAATHGAHYRLMCGPAVRGRDHPALHDAAFAAWKLLTEALERCQKGGRIRAGQPAAFAFVLWCLVHGFATLLVDEQIPPPVLEAMPTEQLARMTTRVLFAGLAGPAAATPR